ncbi:MAG: HNH endonuclease [Pirellulaceae bacterium]|nr:HNH endonuclease [Pirellulaceae bacterium]
MFKSLVTKAWTAVTNPGQAERVEQIVAAIAHSFRTKKRDFDLAAVLEPIDCVKKDVDVATRQYLETFVSNYWKKDIPTPEQKKLILWVSQKLGIPLLEATRLHHGYASKLFGSILKRSLEDGILEAHELEPLNQIAGSCDQSLAEFVNSAFDSEALILLGAAFEDEIATGHIVSAKWEHLQESAKILGISGARLRDAIAPLASSFAEHVLADAKSDGRLDPDEESYLKWLLDEFQLSPQTRQYVAREIAVLREVEQVRTGKLPSVSAPPEVVTKPGEIIHLAIAATMSYQKRLKGGDRLEQFAGILLVTDNRLLFHSTEKAASFSYRSLVAFSAFTNAVRLSVNARPEVTFYYRNSYELAAPIVATAIGLHNQTLTKKNTDGPTRHISRDVRQRVWTAYSGQCADCGARDYLEFDHIIPVAKGGSNEEINVQLLCRRCNLSKSDKI